MAAHAQFGEGPLIMGILNVTPDSFSDGGRWLDPVRAVERALAMVAGGADIVDVGGESTRPGSTAVTVEEEMDRVMPVLEGIIARSPVPVSVDTTRAEVAQEAVRAGAAMLNDVSMLRGGDALARIAAAAGIPLVLMHSRGTPDTMQQLTDYPDGVVRGVIDELTMAVHAARGAGVSAADIWLDPGIGFAKTARQNIDLLAGMDRLVGLGHPVLVGPSRKSFIGALTGAPVDRRQGGTAAAVALCISKGVRAVRVHDVEIMKQAAIIADEIRRATGVNDD